MPPAWLAHVPRSDSWRKRTSADLLAVVLPQVAKAGITRVAELTWLDEIGMPVFQAVRPMSRALSVHQGKGATDDDARLSAIMEAVESAAAEAILADGPVTSHEKLPPGERARRIDDYGQMHGGNSLSANTVMQWHAGERVDTGSAFWLPFDTVSLDLTRASNAGFIRSSTGLAAGATADDALAAAAFELVEREAQARWLASGIVGQAFAKVDGDSIGVEWFEALRDHMRAIGLSLSVYALRGLGDLPVVICRIDEPGFAPSFAGAACRADPADALLRAFSEAAQSRLTVISGTRDDIEPDEPTQAGGIAIGPPTGHPRIDWQEFADDAAKGCTSPVEALIAGGYTPVRLDYPTPVDGVAVVKLVAPGLATDPAMLA